MAQDWTGRLPDDEYGESDFPETDDLTDAVIIGLVDRNAPRRYALIEPNRRDETKPMVICAGAVGVTKRSQW
jgi:hypothetical protein